MATYSGALASNGLPELAEEGEVDFPAMTLRRAMHVHVVNESGEVVTATPEDEKPGSSIENPTFVQMVDEFPEPAPPSFMNDQQAVIVSTTAVRLVQARQDRKSLVIVNNSSGTLYLGRDQGVTTSGATMGLPIPPSATYSDFGYGVYVGEIWGIYSASAVTHNIAVSDRA